jgi:YbbR domain-containing protein
MNFFRRYVLHNLPLKFVSLVLAVGLWLAIAPDERPAEVAVRAPIVFQNVPYDLEISSESIPEAQIRVRGPERLIRQIRSSDIHAEINLQGAKPGERTFDLTSQQVIHPRELLVVQVVPGQVHLAFDTRLMREVPIRPNIVGRYTNVQVEPTTITISGPKQHVEKVDAATTDPLDVSGATGLATFVTSVYVADPLVQVPRPTPIHVTVTIEKAGDTHPH